jgi:hypothetical protein
MRLLGDCCRIPVDMSERRSSLPAPSMEHDGPSSPEPVVHPVPVPAALSTNPIAASCDPQTINSLAWLQTPDWTPNTILQNNQLTWDSDCRGEHCGDDEMRALKPVSSLLSCHDDSAATPAPSSSESRSVMHSQHTSSTEYHKWQWKQPPSICWKGPAVLNKNNHKDLVSSQSEGRFDIRASNSLGGWTLSKHQQGRGQSGWQLLPSKIYKPLGNHILPGRIRRKLCFSRFHNLGHHVSMTW